MAGQGAGQVRPASSAGGGGDRYDGLPIAVDGRQQATEGGHRGRVAAGLGQVDQDLQRIAVVPSYMAGADMGEAATATVTAAFGGAVTAAATTGV